MLAAVAAFIVLAQGVTDDAILIGMEGFADSFSVDEENLGMRLVMREVNAGGGVHGRQLVERSYPRSVEQGVSSSIDNARRLAQEDGVFLLFNFGGPAAVSIGEFAMKHDVPYLFPHTALLTVDGDRHIYTSFPRYDGESQVMLEYLSGERGRQRIGVIHAPNIYGQYFADRARDLAGQLGYEFAGAVALPLRPDSAVDEMKTLRESSPDAVIMALYPAGARKAVEAKADLGWQVELVSSGPLTDEQYLNVEGDAAEGTLGFLLLPRSERKRTAGRP